MRFFFCLIFFLFAIIESKAIDTITIRVDSTCGNFMPLRVYHAVASKTGGGYSYMDSIRICGTIVDAFNKDYYLIVYDANGFKRTEGTFHDEHAVGHCIHYDEKGRKTSEGSYKLVKKRKYSYSEKTGTWKYYNTAGVLIREQKH